jgi:uncharacterized damage-inducible protein DinB
MTSREFFLERRRAELPMFLAVLRAIPPNAMDYTHHERSPSTQQVIWKLTSELRSCIDVARDNRTEWQSDPPPPYDEMLALFERWSEELIGLVEAMDDSAWNRVAKFYVGGKVVSEQPVQQFLWLILFDAIHHRGQLTAYLRPMGGRVPAVYGPSADSRSS